MAVITFQNDALQALYNGSATGSFATTAQLAAFRTGGSALLDADIASLDARIATFESVLVSRQSAAGKTSSDYPYDREGLRREFLDEVAGLLLGFNSIVEDWTTSSAGRVRTAGGTYAAANVLAVADDHQMRNGLGSTFEALPLFQGNNQVVIANTAAGGGNFGNLVSTTKDADGNDVYIGINSDPRLALLNAPGQAVFKSYAALINAVFLEGDKLGTVATQGTQLVSAIPPITAEGITYNRIAQVSGVTTDADGKQIPTYDTYLLETTAPTTRVFKDGSGNAELENTDSSPARRLRLRPKEAPLNSSTNDFEVTVDGVSFSITATGTGINVQTALAPSTTFTPAIVESMSPIMLNVPDEGHLFPDKRILATYRVTGPNGSSFLIGLSTEDKLYVTSLANIPSNVTAVDTTPSLVGLEYLLFYNEARIKILRAQLAYKEAIVREIQSDLKQANAALADLETQNGQVTALNTDNTETGQISAETHAMSVFNATHSTSGKPIFLKDVDASYHSGEDWTVNRTTLKNYIDRRSSEAQEATLDYQNVLNRFNNALEVMAKLQEKLDTLLKSQLRNIA